ncbi:hypothetical protein, partial [Pseudomonas aeruginosa]|uniref:hypothetical protein n=1 Tax=Pseudomonas aeruginosa TaxID=287 RepID=UPI002F956B3F
TAMDRALGVHHRWHAQRQQRQDEEEGSVHRCCSLAVPGKGQVAPLLRANAKASMKLSAMTDTAD